jgi:hypothetical protein
MNTELQNTEFLEILTLKYVAYTVDLAWGKVITANWQKKCAGKDVTEDKMKLIPFRNQ